LVASFWSRKLCRRRGSVRGGEERRKRENVHLDGLGAVNGLAGALAGDLLLV
jgi:hypothetical protein